MPFAKCCVFLVSLSTLLLRAGVAHPVDAQRPDSSTLKIVELLDGYEQGGGPRIAALLASLPSEKFVPLRRDLEGVAPSWIASTELARQPRRRLVAATLALEIVAASFPWMRRDYDVGNPWLWRSIGPLVEWGCQLVRQNPPRAAERLWQLAAIAVAGGPRDPRLSDAMAGGTTHAPAFNHVQHAIDQFPNEPRFPLADAVALESIYPMTASYERAVDDPFATTLRPKREAVIRAFQSVTGVPEIRAEAFLHIAFQRFHLRDYPGARAGFKEASAQGADPFVRYLGFFFAGRMLDRLDQPRDAETSYALALQAVPNAYSSVEALAAKLFLRGQPDEASALVETALAAQPRPDDPAPLFSLGDYRRWPELIRQLRRELQ